MTYKIHDKVIKPFCSWCLCDSFLNSVFTFGIKLESNNLKELQKLQEKLGSVFQYKDSSI